MVEDPSLKVDESWGETGLMISVRSDRCLPMGFLCEPLSKIRNVMDDIDISHRLVRLLSLPYGGMYIHKKIQ